MRDASWPGALSEYLASMMGEMTSIPILTPAPTDLVLPFGAVEAQ